MMVHTGRASGVVALDLTSVPMLVSDTVTNGFEFSVTRERFRPAGTSADRDCSRSSPASRCRTSHGPAGSTSEAHGLQMSRIPPRAPFPNGIARGRRCRLRSKFAADSLLEERDSNLYGAFPVKRLFWVVLTVFCSERERPVFVPSPAIRFPERAEGVKGPKG